MQQPALDMTSLAPLRDIMGDDFAQLIDVFIGDSYKRLEGLRTAVATANANEIRTLAHGFKGSALNISAPALTEICRQLECKGRDGDLEDSNILLTQLELEFERVKNSLQAL